MSFKTITYFDSLSLPTCTDYYAQCFNDGKGPGRTGLRGQNPTHIENVEANWTQPGQFYYDRAGATIGYIPRPGETLADLEVRHFPAQFPPF